MVPGRARVRHRPRVVRRRRPRAKVARLIERRADVLIVGGGLGGVAAAIAAAGRGLDVVLSEPTDWIGGQLTSQAVPPDEHPWIETHGCTATLPGAARRHPRALPRALPAHRRGARGRGAQPRRVLRLAARARAARRARGARGDAAGGGRPAARARAGGGRGRGRPRGRRDAARGRRGHGGGRRLVPRRERDRRPAAAVRRRARHRLRVAGDDRRAARAGRAPAGQPAAGQRLLRRRPPRGRGPHDPAPRPLRGVRPALQLGRARPADQPPGRAAAGAQPGRGRARDRARLLRPRARQGPLALPPHRRARAVRARRLPLRHHARELAADRLPGRGRARRARGRRARAQPVVPALDADRGRLPRACVCAATSSATRPTGSPSTPTSASRGGCAR